MDNQADAVQPFSPNPVGPVQGAAAEVSPTPPTNTHPPPSPPPRAPTPPEAGRLSRPPQALSPSAPDRDADVDPMAGLAGLALASPVPAASSLPHLATHSQPPPPGPFQAHFAHHFALIQHARARTMLAVIAQEFVESKAFRQPVLNSMRLSRVPIPPMFRWHSLPPDILDCVEEPALGLLRAELEAIERNMKAAVHGVFRSAIGSCTLACHTAMEDACVALFARLQAYVLSLTGATQAQLLHPSYPGSRTLALESCLREAAKAICKWAQGRIPSERSAKHRLSQAIDTQAKRHCGPEPATRVVTTGTPTFPPHVPPAPPVLSAVAIPVVPPAPSAVAVPPVPPVPSAVAVPPVPPVPSAVAAPSIPVSSPLHVPNNPVIAAIPSALAFVAPSPLRIPVSTPSSGLPPARAHMDFWMRPPSTHHPPTPNPLQTPPLPPTPSHHKAPHPLRPRLPPPGPPPAL